MALSVVQHCSGSTTVASTACTVNLNQTSGSNNLLVVQLNIGGAPFISTMSDSKGASYTQYASASVPSDQLYTYYLTASSSGTASVKAVFTAADGGNSEMEVWEVSGWTVGPVTDVAATTITGVQSALTATAPSVVTTGLSGFIAACDITNGAVLINPATGNNFTAGGDIISGEGFCSLLSTGASTYTAAWHDNGTSFACLVAAFKDNISGPTTSTGIMNLKTGWWGDL